MGLRLGGGEMFVKEWKPCCGTSWIGKPNLTIDDVWVSQMSQTLYDPSQKKNGRKAEKKVSNGNGNIAEWNFKIAKVLNLSNDLLAD